MRLALAIKHAQKVTVRAQTHGCLVNVINPVNMAVGIDMELSSVLNASAPAIRELAAHVPEELVRQEAVDAGDLCPFEPCGWRVVGSGRILHTTSYAWIVADGLRSFLLGQCDKMA